MYKLVMQLIQTQSPRFRSSYSYYRARCVRTHVSEKLTISNSNDVPQYV